MHAKKIKVHGWVYMNDVIAKVVIPVIAKIVIPTFDKESGVERTVRWLFVTFSLC